MYKRLRAIEKQLMPFLFLGSLMLIGVSAGQHRWADVLLWSIAMVATAPKFHKESWEKLFCSPDKSQGV